MIVLVYVATYAFYNLEKIRKVVLFAGRSAGADTWTYDGVRWTDVTSPGPSERDHVGMTYDRARGKVILFGGGAVVQGKLIELDDTWEWDARWNQLSTNHVSVRSAKPNMVFDSSRGTVLIFGGGNRGKLIGDLWELKGRSWHPAAN